MKYIFIAIIVFVLAFLGWGIYSSEIKEEKEKVRDSNFINECRKEGGRVEQIGSWYSNNYLVCNPK